MLQEAVTPPIHHNSGLQDIINNGEFESEVLTNQSMPRGSKLSQSDINAIQCWVDNGYPEN